jgi:hypothetical protein
MRKQDGDTHYRFAPDYGSLLGPVVEQTRSDFGRESKNRTAKHSRQNQVAFSNFSVSRLNLNNEVCSYAAFASGEGE